MNHCDKVLNRPGLAPVGRAVPLGFAWQNLCLLAATLALMLTAQFATAAAITYNFNDGTIQGWHNRVWDLSANAGAGGWVELDPNVTAMPASINGGAIQPPDSANDGLFGNKGTQVDPVGGNNDNHLNTLWLRSPLFLLDGSGDMTVQMARGKAHGPAPADDNSVSYAAASGGSATGWKGVALRRVSDGVFVLAKPRTTEGDTMVTVTFTQAELAPYVGVACTLDLINSENGGWGWLSMDNVSIPGVLLQTKLTPAFQSLPIGSNASLAVSIPANYNASTAVTVYVTNNNPSVITINGSAAPVTTVVFAAGASTSQTLTLTGAGLGVAQMTPGSGILVSIPASAAVLTPSGLVGRWLTGAQDLLDKSGYTPVGTHDGTMSGGATAVFSTDLPPGATPGGSSLDLTTNSNPTATAVLIGNTVTTDGAYRPTFDEGTAIGLSVVFWAKGLPGDWNPFVSKYGEGSSGWQVRKRAGQPVGTFTVRATAGEDDPYTGSTLLNDGNWHHFAATFDGVGGVRRLYVDGKLNNLVPQDFGPMGLANANYLTLGGRCGAGSSTPGNLFAGLLYDVQIYGIALTGSAVQELYAPTASAIVAYADDPIVDTNGTGTISVSIPAGANASSAVTVYVTNTTPAVASLAGAAANVATVTFPIGGVTSQKLAVTGLTEGTAQFTCAATGLTGASAAVKVYGSHLIGLWFTGLENYADASGFALSGTHDGVEVGATGTLTFSTDTPPSKPGKAAQFGGSVGLLITNSSLLDGAYAPTFDNLTANRLSVAFWAKGLPGQWNPFVTKRGEDGIGWQVRRQGNSYNADYTIRGTPGNDDPQGAIAINDGQWHHFAAVWDGVGGTRKLFVDGTLDSKINLTGDTGPMLYAPNHHLVLGGRETSAVTNNPSVEGTFAGLLYDVRVYNYPLSLVEVSNLSFVAALKLNPAVRSLQAPQTMTVDVILPAGANLAKAITVTVSNQTPSLVSLVGASNNIVTLIYPMGGSLTQQVAVTGITDGKATLKATGGGFAVGLTTFNVWSDPGQKLIGRWLTGAANLTETSGFRPAGKHDGKAVGSNAGLLAFSTDVPWLAAPGSQSLDLSAGNVAVAITNSALTDGDYAETFDGQMMNKFSITFWAKGAFTADWNPWVSKRGENNLGYQVRRHSSDDPVKPCFTIRGTPGDDDPYANVTVDDINWHHYAATWDGTAGLRDIYVDGIRYGLTSGNDVGPMALATGDHFMIGARDNGGFGNFFPGYFFDVRVYSYALSAAEVAVMVNPPTVLGISLARANIPLGSLADLEITVPASATATSPLTVYLTNNSPSVVTIVGSTGNVFPVTFPVGSVVQIVNLQAIGLGQVNISVGSATLGSASLTTINMVYVPKLIGHWLNTASLADSSGYTPAGTHDGVAIGTNASLLAFSSDVPAGYRGQSLDLRADNVGVMITNTANVDGAYLPTFDDAISANFTIAFWAKGFPTSDWNPWVSKQGEGGAGWQIRRLGNNTTAGFTIRGIDNEDGWGSSINVNDTPAKWHHFAGVWDQLTGTRTFYIDGVYSAAVLNNPAQTISLAQTKHLVLGAREGSPDPITGSPFGNFFPGLLYDVRLYNYSMSASDVAALAIVPTIKITPSGTQLRISWPLSQTGYSVEQSSSAASGWGASGLAISVEGQENAAYAPITGNAQFFRLKK